MNRTRARCIDRTAGIARVSRVATILALLGASMAGPAPAQLGAGVVTCVNCADRTQQYMQMLREARTALNTAQQVQWQIRQVNEMLKQGKRLPESVFQHLTGQLQDIRKVYREGAALAGDARDFATQFRRQFKGYDAYARDAGTPAARAETYREWSRQGLDSMRVAMQAAGLNTSSIEDEDALLGQLVQRSQTAEGRMQAIQAGNEIAAQQVQQMMRLRQLINAQIQSQSLWSAQQMQRQAAEDAFLRSYMKHPRMGVAKGY